MSRVTAVSTRYVGLLFFLESWLSAAVDFGFCLPADLHIRLHYRDLLRVDVITQRVSCCQLAVWCTRCSTGHHYYTAVWLTSFMTGTKNGVKSCVCALHHGLVKIGNWFGQQLNIWRGLHRYRCEVVYIYVCVWYSSSSISNLVRRSMIAVQQQQQHRPAQWAFSNETGNDKSMKN